MIHIIFMKYLFVLFIKNISFIIIIIIVYLYLIEELFDKVFIRNKIFYAKKLKYSLSITNLHAKEIIFIGRTTYFSHK